MEMKMKIIAVDQIYPHPDNPRKKLGDLKELTESIAEAKRIKQWLSDRDYITPTTPTLPA